MDGLVSNKIGKLHIIFGSMYSGKTSELLRRVKRYQLSSFRCVVIRYSDGDEFSKLSGSDFGFNFMKARTLENLKLPSDIEVVGVDDGQQFPGIISFCQKQIGMGRTIFVASLDVTFMRNGISSVLQLVPLAHTIEKLSAVCMCCGDKASFSRKMMCKIENIGCTEKYMALCRQCNKIPQPEKSSPFKRLEIEPGQIDIFYKPVKRMLHVETV